MFVLHQIDIRPAMSIAGRNVFSFDNEISFGANDVLYFSSQQTIDVQILFICAKPYFDLFKGEYSLL